MIKLADTLAPLADFPAAYAKDIEFDDGKNLQEKLNNGELGGGGTSITVDTAMSSTSTNPVQNKVIKAYVDGKSVDISADSDNAIQTKTDGIYVEKTKISTDDGNALSKKNDGLFVEDLSNKVNALNIAQKTVNSELEYYYATKTTSISGVPIKHSNLINYLSYLTNITSNLESSRYNTKGVTLKKSKTYRITFGLARATTSGNGTSAYVIDSDGNKLGNRGYFGSNSYSDNIIDIIYTPTKDISVYPALVNLNTNLESTYYPDCSFFQITEIGREVIIDPVEYVNSTKGIEDTPVGEIIRTIGNKTPKHYLMCDGSTHNIADYPHLAQYFKDNFGSSNVFGGDGITTFAVPKYISSDWWSPKMTSNNSPSPYVATASSDNSGKNPPYRAFNDNTSQDIGWHINYLTPQTLEWLQIDLGVSTKISKLKMYPRSNVPTQIPKTIELQGSNDGTTFTSIKTFTTTRPTNANPIELDIGKVVNYRFYKFVMPDYSFQRDDSPGIGTWGMSITQIYFYKYKGDFAFIKAEPTYFMKNTYNPDNAYSADETIVGYWIDGKPIYRKVETISISKSSTDVNLSSLNIKGFISIKGYFVTGTQTYSFPYLTLNSIDYAVSAFYASGYLQIRFGSSVASTLLPCTVYAVIEYTKATD